MKQTGRFGCAAFVLALVVLASSLVEQSRRPVSAVTTTSATKGVAHKANGKRVKAGRVPMVKLFDVDGYDAGEPTLAITKRGEVFFPSIDVHSANAVDVLRSSDDGKSWKNVSPMVGGQKSHPVSLDPYVYVDAATNRIFNIDLTVACSLLSFTDDRGESWTTNPLACGRPVNDHQTLFSGRPVRSPTAGYENIVYYCWNDVASSSCSKSLDGGVTFSPTGSPAFTGVQPSADDDNPATVPFCGGLHGHGIVDAKGWVYLPKESCLQPWLAISKDEGATWANVKVSDIRAGDGILDPSVDVDSKGNIYYIWTGADRRIYLSMSVDGGTSWRKPLVVDAPGVKEANLATLDAGAPGQVAIAYMGSENSPWRHDCAAKDNCPANDKYMKTTWNGYMAVSANVLAKNPIFYSAPVNRKSDPLMRRRCGPGRCGAVFDFIDVVIAPDGTAWAPFVDGCTELCERSDSSSSSGDEGLVAHMLWVNRLD